LPEGIRRCGLTNVSVPVILSPGGTMLAAWQDDNRLRQYEGLRLWDISGALRLLPIRFPQKERVWHVAFSPNSHVLAAAGWKGFIKLWALPSGQEIRTLIGHKRGLSEICFSPDGQTLASIAEDIRLWHVATGRELLRFEVPVAADVNLWLQFSPDGRSLVLCRETIDGPITRSWYAPSFREIAAAEAISPATVR